MYKFDHKSVQKMGLKNKRQDKKERKPETKLVDGGLCIFII